MISSPVRSVVRSLLILFAVIVVALSPASAGNEPIPELPQLIRNAGMIPWRGNPISLEESLRRGVNGEKIQLRQYVTGEAPLLVYMYSYW
jgi:hypothetical protein